MVFFFFKQKTAYEMRISDWSSDVCSSDLAGPQARDRTDGACLRLGRRHGGRGRAAVRTIAPGQRSDTVAKLSRIRLACAGTSTVTPSKIGRASCRERVCQYV